MIILFLLADTTKRIESIWVLFFLKFGILYMKKQLKKEVKKND